MTYQVTRCQTWYTLLICTLKNLIEMKVEVFTLVNIVVVWAPGFWQHELFWWWLSFHKKLQLLCLTVLRVVGGARGSCKLSVATVQCHKPQDHILVQEIDVVCEHRQVSVFLQSKTQYQGINPLNAELNPICHLLALLGVHHFLRVSRIRVQSLTLWLLMSFYIYIYIYIYGAPILDVSRSHTTTHHSR